MLAKGESARQQNQPGNCRCLAEWFVLLSGCLVVCLEDSTERSESNPTLGNKE